ncbi:MAG: 2-oxo acid dehydrogenase subunit E2, partial [Actinomycetota bacterium]|nr:2-oxo acid dehydrogenase subunit E2 [Actinomycetota bacterium]
EQALVTLESDKATMDVPSPSAGKVAALKVSVGDEVSEGSPLLDLEVGGGGDDDGDEPDEEESKADEDEPKADEGSDAENDEGSKEEESETPETDDSEESTGESDPDANADAAGRKTADEREQIDPGEEEDADAEGAGRKTAGERDEFDPPEGSGATVYAGPGVRRMARELGVDLSSLNGSGRKGRILKEDVQAAKDKPTKGADAPAGIPGLDLAPWPKVDFEKYGEVERVPLSRVKKISGPALARNWVMIPHVTHDDEADITELETFRKEINAEEKDVKVTMVALLMKACAAALRQFPEFNSSLDGDELVIKRYFNIGFAADTPQGLLVPVIKEADRKGLLEIARELAELSEKAREGKISAEEMRGSTFTISSLGGIGGTGFTPIINAPEVAILGVTRSRMKPIWDAEVEEFKPRLMVPLSLSYDHRVLDGAAAARFVAHLASELGDLRRALL